MCLSPVVLKNGSRVACGKCYACRRKRALSLMRQLSLHLDEPSCYGVMLTLTYSPENVSYVTYNPSSSYLRTSTISSLLKEFRKTLYSSEVSYIESHQYLHYLLYPSGLVPTFSYSTSRDIVTYIKRVRIYLSRYRDKYHCSDPSAFKYCYVGEYGGLTFRPHFHIVFMCNSMPKQFFESFVTEVCVPQWRKGHVHNSGLIINKESCLSYVSKYIYKPSRFDNPYLVAGVVDPPPCCHSVKLFPSVRAKVRAEFQELYDSIGDALFLDGDSYLHLWSGYLPKSIKSFYGVAELFNETSAGIGCSRLYDLLNPSYIDKTGSLRRKSYPVSFVDSLWPRRKRFYLSATIDFNDVYNYVFDTKEERDSFSLPEGYTLCRTWSANIKDVADDCYRVYCVYCRFRFYLQHRSEIEALSRRLCTDSTEVLFAEFDKLYSEELSRRYLSLECEHSKALSSSALRKL